MATSSNKKKATAKERATERLAGRRGAKGRVSVPASVKKMSQSRHAGESPMTGEDRPRDRPGDKRSGQQTDATGAHVTGGRKTASRRITVSRGADARQTGRSRKS